ncbi:hypothetical protein OG985_28370 [Streptomyces sp. NBC_00289]|uniref:hypothetical protein n=1 Tax=Streptomyces sp. NBC_00289 TaxID=2975703 RepID=UPI003249E047
MSQHAKHVQDEISTHPIGKLLALPAKGSAGRKTAITAYVGLLATSASAGGYALVHGGVEAKSAATTGPGIARADNAAFETEQAPGYRPTYFDGAGGVAGVPFTGEQREALIHEAQRRGLSVVDAYALAYGDQAKITVRPDGTVDVDTSGVTVPNGPVYALLAPGMTMPTPKAGPDDSLYLAAGPAPKVPRVGIPQTGGEGKHHKPGRGSKADKPVKGRLTLPGIAAPKSLGEGGHYYDNSGKNPYQKPPGLKDALPPVVGDVIDLLPGFRQWLGQVSGDTANVDTSITRDRDTVTIAVAATINSDITITTTIQAPADPNRQSDGIVVQTTVSDAGTGEVLGRSDSQEVHDTDSATGVAIGQVVEAVIGAVQQSNNPTNDDTPRPDLPDDLPAPPGWADGETPTDAPVQAEEPPADTETPPADPEAPMTPSESSAGA